LLARVARDVLKLQTPPLTPVAPKQPAAPSAAERSAPLAAATKPRLVTRKAPAAEPTSGAPAKVESQEQPDGQAPLGALLERATQRSLAVTYWFEPAPLAHPYALPMRFVGRRVDVEGKPRPEDGFIYEETFADVTPGSGPVSVTAKIHGINPGLWQVTATPLGSTATRPLALPVRAPSNPLDALWRRYAPQATPEHPVKTRLEPFLHTPGTLPYIWITLVLLGMVVALVTQSLLIARMGLPVGPAVLATLLSLSIGAVGAKVWYIVKRRPARDYIGWCIQGFILGAGVAAGLLYELLHVPIGGALDAAAPGLMLGLAIGRTGCFFAGCCGGPATAAPWGVWCSDQHVGARRVPTQLIESGASFLLGVGALAALLMRGPANGAYFAASVAAYVLAREVILRMRTEKVHIRLPVPATAVAAALVIIVALVVIGR
jgi:phosphatidylglycerol:prolipoprotein diacylglycerol transferase